MRKHAGADMEKYRNFLKDSIRLEIDFAETDQARGLAPPPVEKPFAADAARIDLPAKDQWRGIAKVDLATAIERRRSRRRFSDKPLTLDELAFLLWATQGLRGAPRGGTTMRHVPSAGARHALETYLCVFNVEGLEAGFYRYLPVENQLLFEFSEENAAERISEAVLGQTFVAEAAVVFCWTAVPYRMEWRYGAASHKVIAMDAGHVCQNLYLACEAITAGTCAIGTYHQELINRLLRVDGRDEFTIYLAPVGKIARASRT